MMARQPGVPSANASLEAGNKEWCVALALFANEQEVNRIATRPVYAVPQIGRRPADHHGGCRLKLALTT